MANTLHINVYKNQDYYYYINSTAEPLIQHVCL